MILAASNSILQIPFKIINSLEKFCNCSAAVQGLVTSFQPFRETNTIIHQNDNTWESTGGANTSFWIVEHKVGFGLFPLTGDSNFKLNQIF